jgi:hypothetical protein
MLKHFWLYRLSGTERFALRHIVKAELPALIVLTLGGGAASAWAQLVQWSSAEGGNDHWYELISTRTTWAEARTTVAARTVEGVPGHLAV